MLLYQTVYIVKLYTMVSWWGAIYIGKKKKKKKLWDAQSLEGCQEISFFQEMSRGTKFTCPDCGLEVSLSRNVARVKKKKSAARVALGKRNLAEGKVILVDGKFARGPNAGKTSGKRSSSGKGKEPANPRPTRRRRRTFRGEPI